MKTFPTYVLIRRFALPVGLAIALFTLALTATTRAAPASQTVPPPTEEPVNTPVPTVTPFDEKDDGGNDSDNDSRGNDSGGSGQQNNQPTPAPAQVTPAPTAVAFPGRITVAGLNVRLGPDADYDVIGTLTRTDTFDILGRNEANTWWLICCLPETEMRGWASASFIETEFSREQALERLPVQPNDIALGSEAPASVDIAETTAQTATAATGSVAGTNSLAATELDFSLTHEPAYPQQGDPLLLHYIITNTGTGEASSLLLRNELVDALTIDEEGSTSSGELMVFTTKSDATVFAVMWPTLAPGETITATIALTLAADLRDGSVVDNLAVALADNAKAQTAGLSIGLPPAMPPTFR